MPNYSTPDQMPPSGGSDFHKKLGSGSGIPLWVPIALLFVSPPLGIAVFVLRSMIRGTFPLQRTGQEHPLQQNGQEPLYKGVSAAQSEQDSSGIHRHDHAKKKPRYASGKFSAGSAPRLLAAAGLCLLLYGIFTMMDPLRMLSYGLFAARSDLWPLLSGLFSEVGGCVMLGFSARTYRLRHLQRNLKNAVGKRDNITLAEICRVLSCKESTARAAAEAAVNAGELGPTAFFDHSCDVLVMRGEAPRPAPEQPRQPEAPQSQYEAILQQLRQANDAIPGEEMSEKISRLEDISAKIFELAEKDPSKVPQLRKFMNYYLPTSLKLLKTYAELDAQGISGSNITQSKKEIEATMDTLCNAFAAQLDKLFTSDAMDVSADIAAMQAMLAQDGLTGDTDFTLPG